jgi:hypothetical protein
MNINIRMQVANIPYGLDTKREFCSFGGADKPLLCGRENNTSRDSVGPATFGLVVSGGIQGKEGKRRLD